MKKIIFLLSLIMIFAGCGKKQIEKISENRFLFGTFIQMMVYSDDEKSAKEAINEAFDKISEIDGKYNSKTKGSLIYNLNHSKEKQVVLDDEGIMLFNEVKKVYEMSHGKYDITISPLLEVWGFETDGRENVPSKEELKSAVEKIDFSKVEITGNTIKLKAPVKELDTGSFLKGYAIEQGKKVLAEKGIKNGFISSVSSIATIGGKPDSTSWRVAIQNPFFDAMDSRNNENIPEYLGVVELSGKSLGISGDYQTFVEIQGKRYHHIMDKKTGYPVEDKKLVAVVCDSAFMADMYSTAFFNMEADEVLSIAEKLDIDVLIVDSAGNKKTTKSFNLK